MSDLTGKRIPKSTLHGSISTNGSSNPLRGNIMNRGLDGYSPTVEFEETEAGIKVTITDVTGPHSAIIKPGPKGDRGDPGVYVGPGEMPEDCYIQIDHTGEGIDVVTKKEFNELAEQVKSNENSVQPDWNQNYPTAHDYIKNKPNKLTNFENDLFYANKEDCILDISLEDCEVLDDEWGTFYEYSIYFPQGENLGNYKFEMCGIYKGIAYSTELLRKDDYNLHIDSETNCFETSIYKYDENTNYCIECVIGYGFYDEESESYVNNGTLYLSFYIFDRDTDICYPLEYFNFKFIMLEDKKIKKECLDIPKEITDLFVISYDWDKEDYTANYNEMREAELNDKQLMFYDEYGKQWQYVGYDDSAVTFIRLNYTQSSPKGQRYTCKTIRFKSNGEIEYDSIFLG